MQFRQQVERAILPLIIELRRKIALLPTKDVLNRYQYQINLSQIVKDKLPDGFWAKARYVWTLLLQNKLVEVSDVDEKSQFRQIDELVEKIYDAYGFGAVFESGASPGSEKEFLTRLGLALNVREPDRLGFPEQFREWASARFDPFNEKYFVPSFGLTFAQIIGWIQGLSNIIEARLNGTVEKIRFFAEEMKTLHESYASGKLDMEAVRRRALELKLEARMKAQTNEMDIVHMLSLEEVSQGLSEKSAKSLIAEFETAPGSVESNFAYPHDANPLDDKFLVSMPDGRFYSLTLRAPSVQLREYSRMRS